MSENRMLFRRLKRIGIAVLREIAITVYGVGPVLVLCAFLYVAAKWGSS